jgi:hypothetical protein
MTALLTIMAMFGSATSAYANEPKATICYEESLKMVQMIPKDHRVSDGKLVMFSDIGGVQVEGWAFKSNGTTYIVVASADSSAAGESCRLNLIEPAN